MFANLNTAHDHRTRIAIWLLVVCAMIFVMVVLGGVTRLTESGLSMVEWRPVRGFLPPLSEAAWQAAFDSYRASPEFRRVNFWMTLADFKAIYWMEFAHRVWGRAIGIAFLVPFLYFALRRRLDRALAAKLGFGFLLGGLQGLLGWYMVKSGLVDRPDVSQYRLTAHLGLALVIYGYLLWLALGLLRNPSRTQSAPSSLRAHAALALAWVFITVIWGGFVAGIDAGHIYNTFPLMGEGVVPPGLWSLEPWPLNLFENAATVQFLHRSLAMALLLIVPALWLRTWRRGAVDRLTLLVGVFAVTTIAQAGLGIATLLSAVAIPLAAAHQAGAVGLFTLAVWTLHRTMVPHQPHAAGDDRGRGLTAT